MKRRPAMPSSQQENRLAGEETQGSPLVSGAQLNQDGRQRSNSNGEDVGLNEGDVELQAIELHREPVTPQNSIADRVPASDSCPSLTLLNRRAVTNDIIEENEDAADLESSNNSSIAKKLANLSPPEGHTRPISVASRSSAKSWASTPARRGACAVSVYEQTHGFEGPFDNDFWKQVTFKEDVEGLQRKVAIRETRLDRIVRLSESPEQALFFILENCQNAAETRYLVEGLVSRGVDLTSQRGDKLRTALHVATERGLFNVARLLLDNEAPTDIKGTDGVLPVELALLSKGDSLAALILRRMSKASVRQLFEVSVDDGSPKFNFQDLIMSNAMPQTCCSVLNAMVEPTDEPDEYRFHYRVLETDQNGATPDDSNFNQYGKTVLHRILESKNKEIQRHFVVRMLIHNKWKEYGEKMAWLNIGLYLAFMIVLSTAIFMAATKPDPRKYDHGKDFFRAWCEVVTVIGIFLNMFEEVKEMYREKLHYLKDPYNYVQIPSLLLLLAVIPLRWADINAQWHVASIAYIWLCLRMLQLIAVTRAVGIYMQILTRILIKDVSRFAVIFIIFLLTYTGSLLLALRGEPWVKPVEEGGSSSPPPPMSDDPKDTTELSIIRLTQTYPQILITGIRTMIQMESVIDYVNEEDAYSSFSWLGIIINMLFLFFVLIVLLNILIAQLSDTYADVKADAQRELERNWGLALKNLEQGTSLFNKRLRRAAYDSFEDVVHPEDVLFGWEEPEGQDEKAEEERRQRKLEQHIIKQQHQILNLKSQMRTALVMLKRNEEVPPQLRAALNNLATETLPDLLSGIVSASQENIVKRIDEQYAKNDDDFRSLQSRVYDGTARVECAIDEKQKATVDELSGSFRDVSQTLGSVEDTLNETIPKALQSTIQTANRNVVDDLRGTLSRNHEIQMVATEALGADVSANLKESVARSEEEILKAIEGISSKVPDALDGRFQRLRQRLLSSIIAELQEVTVKLRSDIVREVAQEFDRMQQASDELVARRLRELAMESSQ